ncbi:nuclear transport factor 2 family protein [Undibacterium sp. TJN25]|uniref:nuclear transport factor 2 family protein n=1 Tax=Undibacterium sp. TJN25 TaxID=3413056 RepID=UPI003BF2684A
MTKKEYSTYAPVKPYFDLVREALGDLVDGDHFFDCVNEETIYEVRYDFPGWPRIIKGRAELMESFRGYGKHIELHSVDHLTKHVADDGQVVVIEYDVHGTILASGVRYNNRFCSIIVLANRQIAHWRDYMDSLAAWNALSVTN